jgi:hypothetical protein
MSRLLLAFAIFEGAAVAAFLWAPVSLEERSPAHLLPWACAAAAAFAVAGWPLVDASVRREEEATPAADALDVLADAGLLAAALAPFASAGRALGGQTWEEAGRAMVPALAGILAGATVVWSARVAGPTFGRAGAMAGLAALALGPIGRFLSGVAGSFPGEPVTLVARPWLASAAILFPAAALLLRRLRAGRRAAELAARLSA